MVDYVNMKLEAFIPAYGEFIATAEDDATIRVMMDLEQLIGREITWVRGQSFDNVIMVGNKTRLPSWARRYCTDHMKLRPIFDWWFYNVGEKVNMRIGFRFDEFDRMERFFNNSDPTNYSIPVSCRTEGKKLQRHETFNWRFCSFPLVKNGITKREVDEYWRSNGTIPGDLFTPERILKFPAISNCVGCFHKKVETLAAMAHLQPEKMQWFADQERLTKGGKSLGTWLQGQTFDDIIARKEELVKEVLVEMRLTGQSCDSGGCTD